uniref:G-protein coupled receptors family 1 profile domain-containing protein n=1 Tax=Balaenoptera musculus TaxID=9771 RepID=A0A8C0DLY3_BALMU
MSNGKCFITNFLKGEEGTEVFLFWMFSLFSAFSLLGNGMISGLISASQTSHPSVILPLLPVIIDMSYTSNSVPEMLVNLADLNRTLSFVPCIMQTFLYLTFAHMECLTFVVMFYDRFGAICRPLQYTVIMNWRACMVLAITSWTCGLILALVHAVLLLRLSFCESSEVDHLFYEILPVLKLAYADPWISEAVTFAACVFVLVGHFSSIVISYMCVLCAIFRIQSGERQRKAFSTCSSHLCVVGLFHGIAIIMYIGPRYGNPKEQKKYLLLFHRFFNPMLNPLIYTLRNSEVKNALKRVLGIERAL